MSGHSKWHSIKHKKGAADAKRGKIFSRLSRAITISVREGGPDVAMNFGLRLAIEKAKEANMPKDNIERAIARGQGIGDGGSQLTSALYEAMGPGGSALLIESLTDNPNRTITTVKTLVNKNGGNMEAKVKWLFERKGFVYAATEAIEKAGEELELQLIDAGAETIEPQGEETEITAQIESLNAVKEALEQTNIAIDRSEIGYKAKESMQLDDQTLESFAQLVELLEEEDDVTSVYTNVS